MHEPERIPDLQTAMKNILSKANAKSFRNPDRGHILYHMVTEKRNDNLLVRRYRPVIKWPLQHIDIVDTINSNSKTNKPLLILLIENEIREHKLCFRPNFEMLLYSNLGHCLKVNEKLFCQGNGENFRFPERIITDAKERPVFGSTCGYTSELCLSISEHKLIHHACLT